MAYIDERAGRSQRATVVATVALIQGVAILALVNGLAVKIFDRPEQARTAGAQMPLNPPPEAERLDPPKPPVDPAITRSDRTIVLDRPVYEPAPGVPVPLPEPLPPLSTQSPADPPLPPAEPGPLRPPQPRGDPGSWVTPNDYPTADLREGNQGVTGFRLSVGSDGQVLACEITRSSGFANLDRAACSKLVRRARFRPATQEGTAVPSTFASNIRWQIPD